MISGSAAIRIAVLLSVTANSAAGQQPPGAPPDSVARPKLNASASRAPTPRLDGRLDEATWQTATWLSTFIQREPDEGKPATGRTEVAFVFDDEALYIGARMTTSGASPVRALVTRRDREGSSEQLVVSLDTYHDRRTAYSFGVTAAGVRIDYFHAGDAQGNRDYTFDPVWEAETQVTQGGWTAEMRIPFTQLRFNGGVEQTWGVNVARIIPASNEEDYLVLVRRTETGWASRFAELTGLGRIAASRRIELVPYVASSAQILGAPDRRNPFVTRTSSAARVGGDVKIGLGSSLTLDATINPDFGQVEADPAEVNLSAFETVFPERRPFFVEGSQLLRANQLAFFVSRRIGQSPRFIPRADYSERIQNATILGAAKVTGRLPSGLSVGVLGAVTDEESARIFTQAGNTFGSEIVEPRTGYGVVRLQQEFGAARSTAGFIFTGVRRNLNEGSTLANLLPREAITGAAEWQLRFKGGEYVAFGTAGFSRVQGDSAAILRLQLASAHYFGRPDATHVDVDPSRKSVSGSFVSVGMSKNAGRLLWQGNVYAEAPGFDINDAGRIGSADDRGANLYLRYRHTVPGKKLRSWDVGSNTFNEWNFGNVKQLTLVQGFSNQTWRNFWQTSVTATYIPRALQDNLTRGGPLMGYGANWSVNGSLATNPARKTQWRLTPTYAADEMDGWTRALSGGVSVRPGTRIELSADPAYSRWVNPRQFFANLSSGSPATFDRRYLFSYIERSELSARFRVNYALGTNLTLETYAEPFASSGRYYRLGELPAAGSYSLREYGTNGTTISRFADDSLVIIDGPSRLVLPVRDFNILSFRSNFVLRWEWRRGSTAYVVWQQNRGDQRTAGNPVRLGSLYDALTTTGDNVFAIKLNYWLPF